MGPNDGLERVRILAAKTLLALIVAMTVSTLTGVTPDVDIAVFATTMGGLLACCLLYTSPSPRDA